MVKQGYIPLYILIQFWGKALKTDDVSMKTPYNVMLEGMKNGHKMGRFKKKSISDMYGFSYVWSDQEVLTK